MTRDAAIVTKAYTSALPAGWVAPPGAVEPLSLRSSGVWLHQVRRAEAGTGNRSNCRHNDSCRARAVSFRKQHAGISVASPEKIYLNRCQNDSRLIKPHWQVTAIHHCLERNAGCYCEPVAALATP